MCENVDHYFFTMGRPCGSKSLPLLLLLIKTIAQYGRINSLATAAIMKFTINGENVRRYRSVILQDAGFP